MHLVTPKAGAKFELLFNKPSLEARVVMSYVFKKKLKCILYPSCDVIDINCLFQTEVIFEYKADLSRTGKCDQNHITDKNAFGHTES